MSRLKVLWKMYTNQDSVIFQLGFAYSILLSLIPLLVIFVVLFNRFALNTEALIEIFGQFIETNLLASFIKFFNAENSGELLSLIILLIISINLGSRAFITYLYLTQRIEETKYKWWFLKLRALLGLITFVVVFTISLYLATRFSLNNSLVQFMISIVSLLILYRGLALEHRSIKNLYKGALISGVGLYLMTYGLYYFFNNLFNYKSIYGPLASLMVLFLSIYILAKIIHLGYCINYVYRDRNAEPKGFMLYEWVEGKLTNNE